MAFVSNFALLQRHAPKLADLGAKAEAAFTDDPNVAIYRLRQLAEGLAGEVALRHGVQRTHQGSDQFGLLKELERRGYLDRYPASLFHKIRLAGNRAVHEFDDHHGEAAAQLRNARNLCVWFEGAFGDPDVRPPRFMLPPPPPDPSVALARAHADQEALEARLAASEAEREAYAARVAAQAERLARPRVLFSDGFLARWKGLGDERRSRLGPALAGFRDAPDLEGLDRFGDIADPKFRWLPLDADDCMVAAVSPAADVVLCTWVGPFEGALAWVRPKVVEVHPALGSLQVYEPRPAAPPAPAGLFADLSDDQLRQCGVPDPLLPAARAVADRDGLGGLARYLPAEAADTLAAIADGQSFADARREAGLRTPARPVDPSDFDAALGHQASRRHFADLDDATFAEMLAGPLDAWRVFLHPSQDRVVRARAKGPVRVLGGAGTGKTVALLHRAVHLLRHVLGPDDRVLITTFTRTMAGELERSLGLLATPEERSRVEVSHLHQWATGFLRRQGRRFAVVKAKAQKGCWAAAIAEADPDGARDPQFYRDEWELVVQAQGIIDRGGYFRAIRTGRGTRLNRRARAAVWKVFTAYRSRLEANAWCEWPDLIRYAREALEGGASSGLRSVLVDEVQDFGQAELQLLRAMVPEAPADLFLVGDAHQRIYQLGTSFGRCGIHIRGRSWRLKVNYRTTGHIQRFAMGVLDGVEVDDLDDGADHWMGYRSLRDGAPPEVVLCDDAEAERAVVVDRVRGWLADGVPPSAVCVSARSGWLARRYGKALDEAGVAWASLDSYGPVPDDAVRVSTFHRLKGTEFSRVVLAAVQDGVVPLERAGSHSDEAAAEDFEQAERCLLYVAATRARDSLVVTGVGRASPLLCPSEE